MSARIKGLDYSLASLKVMLRGYAQLEASGRVMSATALAERCGFSGNSGPGLRRACIALGWLEVVEPPRGKLPGRLRLTDASRAVLAPAASAPPSGRPRPAAAPRTPPAPAPSTAKPRTCLSCRQSFPSAGPGNRICPPCAGTEAFRTSDPGCFPLVLP